MGTGADSETVTTVKLSDMVYAKIAGLIRAGDYPVHSKLPTENDLADILSVSRPVVREALARLRRDQVITSRRGSGSYVLATEEKPQSPPSLLGSIADLRRLIEFRISLEGENAYHAALGRSDDREMLKNAMARLESQFQGESVDFEADFAFHRGVAVATGNRFLVSAIDAIRQPMLAAMGVTTSFITASSPDRLQALPREHRAIFDSIMTNDAEGAKAAMRTHLDNSKRRVFEGVDG